MISPEGDIPLLREVRNSRFVSRSQLFSILNGAAALSPATYTSRLARLLERGYLRAVPNLSWHGSTVLSIAPLGLMELESCGELNLALHSLTRHMPHALHAYHALELNEIRLALLRSSLLADWKSEVEIASLNMVSSTFQKDYDALVGVWVGQRSCEFALEYERSLKAARRYRRIGEALEAEGRVSATLYLTASPDLMYALLYHLSPSSRPLAFAVAYQFRRHLLATPVLTDPSRSAVTLDRFLVAATTQNGAFVLS